MKFNSWLDVFLEEKGIDLEQTFELTSSKGVYNLMSYRVVVEHMKIANSTEQAAIKDMIVKIDFKNGDVRHFLRHLGQALVESKDL